MAKTALPTHDKPRRARSGTPLGLNETVIGETGKERMNRAG
jgi:hypothetical protein